MGARQIAETHFRAALAEAMASDIAPELLARYMLSCVIAEYVRHRPPADVRAELVAAADNLDPDADYAFMRP